MNPVLFTDGGLISTTSEFGCRDICRELQICNHPPIVIESNQFRSGWFLVLGGIILVAVLTSPSFKEVQLLVPASCTNFFLRLVLFLEGLWILSFLFIDNEATSCSRSIAREWRYLAHGLAHKVSRFKGNWRQLSLE